MPAEQWMRIRASDEEREWIVGRLRDAYAAGRLDGDEFEERSTAAYRAKTWGSLSDLTADLPVPAPTCGPASDEADRDEMDEHRPAFGPAFAFQAGVLCLLVGLAVHLSLIGLVLLVIMLCVGHGWRVNSHRGPPVNEATRQIRAGRVGGRRAGSRGTRR